jgi:hypothetical protein
MERHDRLAEPGREGTRVFGVTRRSGVSPAWSIAGLVLLATSACTAGPSGRDAAPSTWSMDSTARPFAAGSPWNSAIPADPELDPQSEDMVSSLIEDGGGHALLYEFGVPVYEAGADTPKVTVTCTKTTWGRCPLRGLRVPIPAGARPSPGSDGAMVVVDRGTGRVYDFWQIERAGSSRWRASWGTWTALSGAGVGGEVGGADGGSTGAGVNLLAGLVRVSDVKKGAIDHALALVSDKSCPGDFRYPATKTDGHASEPTCTPEGARVQLDPSIDVDSLPDIDPAERAVAKALQTYGGYLRDSGGASLGIAFEMPTADDPYAGAGLPWDYYNMPHIPWDRLRVLSSWNGS